MSGLLRRLPVAVALAALAIGAAPAGAAPAPQAACAFVLGSKVLSDALGAPVGGSGTEGQRSAPNGNAEQRTARGLLVWRKADNWTPFTDGFRNWINGPAGLQQRINTERFPWEREAPEAPPAAPMSEEPTVRLAAALTRDLRAQAVTIRVTLTTASLDGFAMPADARQPLERAVQQLVDNATAAQRLDIRSVMVGDGTLTVSGTRT